MSEGHRFVCDDLYYCICCKTFTEGSQFELKLLKTYYKNKNNPPPKKMVRKTQVYWWQLCCVCHCCSGSSAWWHQSDREKRDHLGLQEERIPHPGGNGCGRWQWLFWKGGGGGGRRSCSPHSIGGSDKAIRRGVKIEDCDVRDSVMENLYIWRRKN